MYKELADLKEQITAVARVHMGYRIFLTSIQTFEYNFE